MSLALRAQQAESKASSFDEPLSPMTLSDLRRLVKKQIAFEDLAVIARENPLRARNELRAACRQVLSFVDNRQFQSGDKERLTEALIDIVFGWGPLDTLLKDESITEIMVNGTQSIFYESHGCLYKSDLSFESDDQIRLLIDRIIGPLGRRIDESSPMVNARLPEGHRVNAIIPPLALDGPILTIRLFPHQRLSLQDLYEKGTCDREVAQFLFWAVNTRKNLAVSGATGSGKTTLLNALSDGIPRDERLITIEDAAELRLRDHPHVVRLEARPPNAEGKGEVTIRELVINALRMRPDRIIVGECRGAEAFDMLQAMTTGHAGSLTTLHADAPEEAIGRLVSMVRYAVDLPLDAIEAQIASAFDYIVQIERSKQGDRFISRIAELRFDQEKRRCLTEMIYSKGQDCEAGTWHKDLPFPREFPKEHVEKTKEVHLWTQTCSGQEPPSDSEECRVMPLGKHCHGYQQPPSSRKVFKNDSIKVVSTG